MKINTRWNQAGSENNNRNNSAARTALSQIARLAGALVIALTTVLSVAPRGEAKAAPANYIYYLPMVAAAPPMPEMPGMGVAGSTYPDLLNADWHYAYEWCGFHTEGCTPMVKWWEMPELCPPVLLVGNEPNASAEAGGGTMSPEEAAKNSKAIRAMCPREVTYMIAGNVAQADIAWTQAYLNAGGVYDAVGVHCYSGTAAVCLSMLTNFKSAVGSAPICVTEWNLLSPQFNAVEFEKLMDGITQMTPCSAVFSDSYQGTYWSWQPKYWLVEDGGVLNAHGQVYAAR